MARHTTGDWEVAYREVVAGESMRMIGTATKLVAAARHDDDAAFIVTAVNAHDDLLAACHLALAKGDTAETVRGLIAAIAKAEGR